MPLLWRESRIEMNCNSCDYETELWRFMKIHYMIKHPQIDEPEQFFTNKGRK